MSNNSVVNVTLTNSGSGYKSIAWPFLVAKKHTSENRVAYDLLAASAHLYRVHGNNLERFQGLGLNDGDGFKNQLTDEDFKLADDIADYFSKIIVLKGLRGESLTEFHRMVADFLTDRCKYDNEMAGMIYRLPEYYDMDQQFLEMKDFYFNDHEHVSILLSRHSRKLAPITKILRITRAYKVVQYWFKDIETGNPVNIDIDLKNKLTHLWDHFFKTCKEISIEGEYFDWTHPLKLQCTTVKNWELKL